MAHPLACIDIASLIFQCIDDEEDMKAFLLISRITTEQLSSSWQDVLYKCVVMNNGSIGAFSCLQKSKLYISMDESQKLGLIKELHKSVHDTTFEFMDKCPVMQKYMSRVRKFENDLGEKCKAPDVDAVRDILDANTDIIVGIPHSIFLDAISHSGSPDIVKLLLAYGICPRPTHQRHPLEIAASNGRTEIISILAPIYTDMDLTVFEYEEYDESVMMCLAEHKLVSA